MQRLTNLRRAAATVAFAALGLSASVAAAGNLRLTMEGLSAPVDILAFSLGATFTPPPAGASYSDASFSVQESPASPFLLLWTSNGLHRATAQFQLISPVTALPVSDWTFTDVNMTSFAVSTSDPTQVSNNFSFGFGTVTYKVYAPNGSVAAQMCWNVAVKAAC